MGWYKTFQKVRILWCASTVYSVFHDSPQAVPDTAFLNEAGEEITLRQYEGKVVVLNFWATWCAPCRHEMPSLNALQKELGSDNFAVVTVATGRNPPPAIARFFEDENIDSLPRHRDPQQALARGMAVFGLPMTVILNENGEEIARLQRQKARFINTTVMVSLLGAACSDGLEDGRKISGVGGQYNFVAMAHALDDARSVVGRFRCHGGESSPPRLRLLT